MFAAPVRRPPRWVFVFATLLLMLQAGCEQSQPVTTEVQATASGTRVLTLGDIDPDEPATRVRRLQPLADYLARNLRDFDIGRGRVVIARNIEEMAALMESGEVDLLFDSPFPVLAVNTMSTGRPFLLRHARGDAEYWSLIVTRKDSGLRTLPDLNGTVLVFQERHSTSGYLLPASLLSARGYTLETTPRPDSSVPPDRIGCYFSGDEENTVELIRSGRAPAGVLSDPDFRALPAEARDQLRVIERTLSVPRQLVGVRGDLEDELQAAIGELLLGLTDDDRKALAAQDAPYGWTWKFDSLSTATLENLASLEQAIGGLAACGRSL
ncbi:MAG: phosphate/phosphite/phosphonate ABC transporter substrate-binding protein [Pseudomonadota bacterium]